MEALIWCLIFLSILSTLTVLSCMKVSGKCSDAEEKKKQEKA